MPFVYLKFLGFSTISKFVSNFVCSLLIMPTHLTQVFFGSKVIDPFTTQPDTNDCNLPPPVVTLDGVTASTVTQHTTPPPKL
jgi:hypothetical protein